VDGDQHRQADRGREHRQPQEDQMSAKHKAPRRRRPRGSGSVYQLHRPACSRPAKGCDCIWWIRYCGPDGRRIAESSESRRKGDAERLLRQRVGARENNLPVIPNAERLTFNEAAQAVINDFIANNQRSIAVVRRRIEKHLIPFFGGRRLVGITRDDVTAYIADRQKLGIVGHRGKRKGERISDVSNGEINRELQILKRIFNLAIDGGRIATRPKFKMLAEAAPRSGFFEAEQLASVLAHLPAEIQPVIEFAAITGWRVPSEVLTMQWRQVDREAGEVRLDAGSTKNGDGRTFPLTTELRRILDAQHAAHGDLKKAGHIFPFVFFRMVANGRGGEKSPKRITAFGKAWKSACKAAGCPGRVPHDLRRTAVRNLTRVGVPQTVAMKLTGHRTDSVFRRYDIVSPHDLRVAVERLNHAAFAPAGRQAQPGTRPGSSR
jgi:integrase